MTNIKNLGFLNAVIIVPVHVSLWFSIAFFSFFKGRFKDGYWVIKGILYVFMNFNKILKKREAIQKKRKVSDKDLLPRIMRKREFSYFYKKLVVAHKIGNTEGFYKS